MKLMIQEYKDPEKIKIRKAKYCLQLIEPKQRKWFISSLYQETGYFAFDYKGKYYKLHIDPEANTAKVERYNLFIL